MKRSHDHTQLKRLAAISLVLVMCLSALPMFVTDASAQSPASYDYRIASNAVLDANGDVVYTGSNVTDAIRWAVSNQDTATYLPAGSYTITTDIELADGVTLYGAGPSSTSLTAVQASRLKVSGVSDASIMALGVSGNISVWISADVGETITNITIENVESYGLSKGAAHQAAFYVVIQANATLDGLDFINCHAYYPARHGFKLDGYSREYSFVKNVTFTDCTSTGAGLYERDSDWTTGFDVVERANVENVTLTNCAASYSWESGFHMEHAAPKRNIRYVNCVASYNGQKPDATYGVGFLFDHGQVPDVTYIDCTGSGNSRGLCTIAPTSTILSTKVWAQDNDGLASSGIWIPDGPPKDNDLLFFKDAGHGNCTLDLEQSYTGIRVMPEYGGHIVQGDVNLTVLHCGLTVESGVWTGNPDRSITLNYRMSQSLTGKFASYSCNVIINGDTRLDGELSLYRLHVMEGCTVTTSNLLVRTYHLIVNGTLSTKYELAVFGTLNIGQIGNLHIQSTGAVAYHSVHGKELNNDGLVDGAGRFNIYPRDRDVIVSGYGVYNCTMRVYLVDSALKSGLVTLDNDLMVGDLSVLSGHSAFIVTLDANGHDVIARNISVGVRGVLMGGDGNIYATSWNTTAGIWLPESSTVVMRGDAIAIALANDQDFNTLSIMSPDQRNAQWNMTGRGTITALVTGLDPGKTYIYSIDGVQQGGMIAADDNGTITIAYESTGQHTILVRASGMTVAMDGLAAAIGIVAVLAVFGGLITMVGRIKF